MRQIQTKFGDEKYWQEVNLAVSDHSEYSITIEPTVQFQEHLGFGGAFTEAAAFTISQAPDALQNEAIDAYFSESGLQYNLGRLSIHSCDFSLESYTYIEEGDEALAGFDISREDQWVIPLIRKAKHRARETLLLMSSPWSPPAFMKTNHQMCHGGELLPQYQSLWAEYIVRYINEMRQRDISIWAVSVQNEPMAVQIWESCIYSSVQEREFVKDFLGPALTKTDTKLFVWDHNRDLMVERAQTILSDPKAAKYVWGIANHWYVSEDFSALQQVHDLFPDKHILFTEGTVEYGIYGNKPRWENGEHYGRNIIGDFSHWSRGWIDWNLYLNEEGGPNHVGNFCEAPIMYDRNKQQLIYNVSYYYIGHFSRYIKRGARRIGFSGVLPENTYGIAYQNPDGTIILVLQNESNNDYVIDVDQPYLIHAHSIVTFIEGENR